MLGRAFVLDILAYEDELEANHNSSFLVYGNLNTILANCKVDVHNELNVVEYDQFPEHLYNYNHMER